MVASKWFGRESVGRRVVLPITHSAKNFRDRLWGNWTDGLMSVARVRSQACWVLEGRKVWWGGRRALYSSGWKNHVIHPPQDTCTWKCSVVSDIPSLVAITVDYSSHPIKLPG